MKITWTIQINIEEQLEHHFTYPSIRDAVSTFILSRKISKSGYVDWTEVEIIFKYLKNPLNFELQLGKSEKKKFCSLIGYVDADWEGNRSDRKANTGYLFIIFGAVIYWRSKKESCVSLSATEAGNVVLSDACHNREDI
ncbi:hypothetical protein JTB14_001928 [Gonioctena quinquepunctata]|nr:hypothetical protein JTB14_001928 [Gonioctena quinquepunctata]